MGGVADRGERNPPSNLLGVLATSRQLPKLVSLVISSTGEHGGYGGSQRLTDLAPKKRRRPENDAYAAVVHYTSRAPPR